jgi:hypothetical protein
MSTTDWTTVTSDLQRAANNLAWFVLESMTIPSQPPPFLSVLPTDAAAAAAAQEQDANRKRKRMNKPPKDGSQKRMSIGKAVDRLVSETLV